MSTVRVCRGFAQAALAVSALVAAVLVGFLGVPAPAAHAAAPTVPAADGRVGGVDLGPNVYVFYPTMAQSDIQAMVDAIGAQQVGNQFGDQRYALLFAPGTYGSAADPLNFQVGYYTEVAGLGRNPGDVVINGSINVYNQCDSGSCTALNNFWRSMSNLTINVAGNSGCYTNEFWATSQATSLRRVQVNGQLTLMDYCTGPSYASGGFIADSSFTGTVINGSQQQYFVRNSNLQNGWSNSVWNQVFVGTSGAPTEQFGVDDTYYTTIAQTPVEQEKPYLFLDGSALKVFVPSAAANTIGTSWQNGATPGTVLPISRFLIATPSTSLARIDLALALGQNLLLTPGVYQTVAPILVARPHSVVLGLGLATIEPVAGNDAMIVAGVAGVRLAGIIFDAGPSRSPQLLWMLPSLPGSTSANDPSSVQDVYFRVGGAHAGQVTSAFDLDTSNVVLDNIWSWRADHGAGVGWTSNVARYGLRVGGANVTAYGLFVEHFQDDEIVWSGRTGRVYMLQNEMPYDVPSQAAWQSPTSRLLGHAALTVTSRGYGFRGYGMGSYSFFNQGVDIHATQAFTLAPNVDAHVHDVLTVFLDKVHGSGGIDSVVNAQGASSTAANADVPVTVTDY